MNRPLVDYQYTIGEALVQSGQLYDYVTAANGIFVTAANSTMRVCMPLNPIKDKRHWIRGLKEINPRIRLPFNELLSSELLIEMVRLSKLALPNEILFHITLSDGNWKLNIPPQINGQAFTRPLESGGYIPIEIHSHNTMPAFFSETDDRDENGLRIYGVLGRVDQEIVDFRLRVSVYGHYSVLPYEMVFQSLSYVKNA